MAMEGSRGEESTSWNNLENHGERAIHAWYVGVVYFSKEQWRRGFGMMQRGRSMKEYKVSGSRNRHSGRSWSRLEQMQIWNAAQKSCGHEMGRLQRRMQSVWEVI